MIVFDIYTKEELKTVVDRLLKAGNNYEQLFNWIPQYSYQYYANTYTYDIYYYGIPTLRYSYSGFVMYL